MTAPEAEGWDELERLAKARQAATKNRATTEPGGVGCERCGTVFVGDEGDAICGICYAEDEYRGAANPSAVLKLIEAARLNRGGDEGRQAGEGEAPVAWRWRSAPDKDWWVSVRPFSADNCGEPLYTRPTPATPEGLREKVAGQLRAAADVY